MFLNSVAYRRTWSKFSVDRPLLTKTGLQEFDQNPITRDNKIVCDLRVLGVAADAEVEKQNERKEM
jgi:hypothetical protein